MTVEAWRLHPLMADEHVQRWMRSRTLRATYRLRSLRALDRYCQYRHLSPTELIGEAVESAMSPDPVKRLRPKDQLNRWREQLGTEYQSVVMIRQILPFYEENGCHIDMLVQNPKTPARENRTRATQELTRRFLDDISDPQYRWAVICEAETGLRPNSLVNLKWDDITQLNGGPLSGMLQIRVPGRQTKTGQSYWSFTFNDARTMLAEVKVLSREERIVSFSAQQLEHSIDRHAQRLGINPSKGLRPFSCGAWRRHVQNALEGVGIAANRVSLLMGRAPKGPDSHYTSPPPETLGLEYLKARGDLIVYT